MKFQFADEFRIDSQRWDSLEHLMDATMLAFSDEEPEGGLPYPLQYKTIFKVGDNIPEVSALKKDIMANLGDYEEAINEKLTREGAEFTVKLTISGKGGFVYIGFKPDYTPYTGTENADLLDI